MNNVDVKHALAAITQANRQLAARAGWPLWRHAIAGLILGLIVASAGLPSGAMIAVLVLCLAVVPATLDNDRCRDGFSVSGYQAGRTRWVTLLVIAISIGTIWTVLHVKNTYHWWAAPFLGGFLIFFVATFGSLLWQRVYQADLAKDQ
jgi:hypothetical protein